MPVLEQSYAEKNAGATIYTPLLLHVYDWFVLSFTNSFVWKCSTADVLLPLFRSALSDKHLDIGVGTGYYLANSGKDSKSREITLVDLNQNSLRVAKERIRASFPERTLDIKEVIADATEPLPFPPSEKFKSISLFYLLHCIPGPVERKNRVFDAIRPHLAEDGVVVGATVLGRSRPMNFLARIFMRTYNKKRILHNWDDDVEGFEQGLKRNFEDVQVWLEGRTMLFKAGKPRQ